MKLLNWLLDLAAKLITKIYADEALQAPQPTPMPTTSNPAVNSPKTPNPAPNAKSDPLTVFCTAIKTMEGANPANNNPGNCRCSPVGYLPKYGKVTCNPHNFAVFPTYALGWDYLKNLVHYRILTHPDWTFIDFFNVYAPSSDANDPTHYANVVAKACGVPVDNTVSSYFTRV